MGEVFIFVIFGVISVVVFVFVVIIVFEMKGLILEEIEVKLFVK